MFKIQLEKLETSPNASPKLRVKRDVMDKIRGSEKVKE